MGEGCRGPPIATHVNSRCYPTHLPLPSSPISMLREGADKQIYVESGETEAQRKELPARTMQQIGGLDRVPLPLPFLQGFSSLGEGSTSLSGETRLGAVIPLPQLIPWTTS